MPTITRLCPAKLNLFLHITGKRTDGYHNLQTLFVRLNYGDELTLASRNDGEIVLSNALPQIATTDNLIYRATQLIKSHTNTPLGCTLALDKNLPIGGGLGGGSSNAAGVLLGLNELWQLNLSRIELLDLALQLGADVPFFILETAAAWGEGVGEKLTPVAAPETVFLVACPKVQLPTAQLFADSALKRTCSVIAAEDYRFEATMNVFEPVACARAPQIKSLIEHLRIHAPARLTGSGSCVFACFDSLSDAHTAAETLPPATSYFIAQSF